MSSKRIDMDALKDFAAELLPPGEPSDDAAFLGECILIAALLITDAIERAG